jgi:hypothetical protein
MRPTDLELGAAAGMGVLGTAALCSQDEPQRSIAIANRARLAAIDLRYRPFA